MFERIERFPNRDELSKSRVRSGWSILEAGGVGRRTALAQYVTAPEPPRVICYAPDGTKTHLVLAQLEVGDNHLVVTLPRNASESEL